MWKHVLAAATLALVPFAWGSSASPRVPLNRYPICVNVKTSHEVYLIIQHLSSTVVQKCVGFEADQLNGDELMRQSGVGYTTQQFRVGTAICSIDGEPAQVTECFPRHGPWWSLWVSTGGAGWLRADSGYFHIALKDGDALGWRYAIHEAPPPLPTR